jgi:acyl-CoA thioesterase FadM
VNLYLRLLSLLLRLWIQQPPRRDMLEESRVAFRVLPNDCDINFHMNNGRYLSFMDLGRVHLMAQSGLLPVILKQGWMPVLTAAEINFIRSIAPLQKFELVTRLVSWDDKYFYIEQKFESRGALCAHAYVKGLFLLKGAKVSNAEVVAASGYAGAPPPLPEELRLWAELGNAKKQRATEN